MGRAIATLLGLALAVAACADGDTSGREVLSGGEPTLSVELRAHLDSGTQAYRAGQYDSAREHYGRAVEEDPHFAGAWLGVSMALRAGGDAVGADSALAEAQRLAPGQIMSHPDPGAGGMPSPHPATPATDRPTPSGESPPGLR